MMNRHIRIPTARPAAAPRAALPAACFLAAALFLARPPALPAGPADLPPQGSLWAGMELSASIAPDRWDNQGLPHPDALQFAALGFALEYGVLPWASLSAQWQPGVLLAAYAAGGPTGSASDFRFALRFSLLGEQSLINISFLRLSLLAGVNMPFPSGEDTAWEPDSRLWGLNAGASLDYLPSPWFQLSLSASALLNPEQFSGNPAFARQTVNHPLDLRFELEPRFSLLNPNGVIATLPVVYEYSPESTIREQAAGDGRHFLYLGLGYTIAVRDVSLPFEVRTRFLAPVFGTNQHLFQRVEISGKVEIPVAKP